MNLLPQEPMATELEDVAERAERGRAFYYMFPGTTESDRWLEDFEHVDTPAHGAEPGQAPAETKPTDRRPL